MKCKKQVIYAGRWGIYYLHNLPTVLGHLKNPHGFFRGGESAKNHVCPQGGGGIKNVQKSVHMVYE